MDQDLGDRIGGLNAGLSKGFRCEGVPLVVMEQAHEPGPVERAKVLPSKSVATFFGRWPPQADRQKVEFSADLPRANAPS